MIVGDGMLARAFSAYKDRNDVLVFASGVSNSRETAAEAYEREVQLLEQYRANYPKLTLIYFSTCSILDHELAGTPYVQHKQRQEARISQHSRFHIFRLPQVVGFSDNPHTLANFFYQRLINHEPVTVWAEAERNLIDVADVYRIAAHCIDNRLHSNQPVNIAAPSNIRVADVLAIMSEVTGCAANVILEPGHQGSRYQIDIEQVKPCIDDLGITFDKHYYFAVLQKYYGANSSN